MSDVSITSVIVIDIIVITSGIIIFSITNSIRGG